MGWVRDVLTGAEPIDLGRHTRDAFHWLNNQEYHGPETLQRLNEGFAELISDPDRDVRGAAVLWFAGHVVPGVGPMLVAAFTSRRQLYEGVKQEWSDDRAPLDQIMALAIAKNALDVPGGLEIARTEALRPYRGGWMVSILVRADPLWVRSHLAEIATHSPTAIEVLFFHLGLLGVNLEAVTAHLASDASEAGGALLKALHTRGLDLEQAVLRLLEQVGEERVTLWLNAVVEDDGERARYLGML